MSLLEYLTTSRRNALTNAVLKEARDSGILDTNNQPTGSYSEQALTDILEELEITPAILRYGLDRYVIDRRGGGYCTTDGLQLDRDGIRGEILADLYLAASGGSQDGYRRPDAERKRRTEHPTISLDQMAEQGIEIAAPDELDAIDTMIALEQACESDTDRAIIAARMKGCTLSEIAENLSVERRTVRRSLDRIEGNLSRQK